MISAILPFLARVGPGLARFTGLGVFSKGWFWTVLSIAIPLMFWGWEHWQHSNTEHRLQVVEQQLEVARQANRVNQDTIDRLANRNAQLADSVRVSESTRRQAAKELAELQRSSREELVRRLEELRETMSSEGTDCEDLLEIDVADFCPATVERMRQNSANR